MQRDKRDDFAIIMFLCLFFVMILVFVFVVPHDKDKKQNTLYSEYSYCIKSSLNDKITNEYFIDVVIKKSMEMDIDPLFAISLLESIYDNKNNGKSIFENPEFFVRKLSEYNLKENGSIRKIIDNYKLYDVTLEKFQHFYAKNSYNVNTKMLKIMKERLATKKSQDDAAIIAIIVSTF